MIQHCIVVVSYVLSSLLILRHQPYNGIKRPATESHPDRRLIYNPNAFEAFLLENHCHNFMVAQPGCFPTRNPGTTAQVNFSALPSFRSKESQWRICRQEKLHRW